MITSYKIIKSKRKSLGISIKPDGSIIVRVPLKTSSLAINQFVSKYQGWIKTKLAKIETMKNASTKDAFYFMGIKYSIKPSNDKSNPVKFNGEHLLIHSELIKNATKVISRWYQLQSYQLVEPIIQEYSNSFGFQYFSLKITTAKNRWGSCNSLGTICFSYRIAMLPVKIIRYIVAHELSHLKHLNHSKDFWQQVSCIYPDYLDAHNWLKENEPLLVASLNG